MRSLISWMGGKYYEHKYLINKMPRHKKYLEVFGGSGVILLNKPKSFVEFYNDKFASLVSFWEVIQDSSLSEALIRRAKRFLDSKYLYDYYRKTDLKDLDIVDRAFRFMYLVQMGYNSYMDCHHTPLSLVLDNMRFFPRKFLNTITRIHKVQNRIQKVHFSNYDFRECLTKSKPEPGVFIFLDPPYIDTHSYDKGYYDEAEKGVQMYEDMRDLLEKQTEGGTYWMITCNETNEYFDEMTNVRIDYITRRGCINNNETVKDITSKVVMNYPKELEGTVFELNFQEKNEGLGDFLDG